MRLFLALWLAPGTLFWSWHLLSSRDILFPRWFHDQVFLTYGALLHVDPSAIPSLFANAFATDSLLILAIFAFKRRKAIAAWIRDRRQPSPAVAEFSIEASRSSAP